MFDLDDFYSLAAYAARFSRSPVTEIALYLSQKSTVAAVAALEAQEGYAIPDSAIEELFRRAESDEMTTACEFVALTGCRCIVADDEDVAADIRIYNDFVAFLTARGINC